MTDTVCSVTKDIPAFAVSVFQLMWIWHTHSVWSKRFGLEDAWSVFLSVLLIILVLVYIYPLKIMFSGMFAWLSQGFLPSAFELESYTDLRIMFIYFSIGFMAIFMLYALMYRHAKKLAKELLLNDFELHTTTTQFRISQWLVGVGLVAAILAAVLPAQMVVFSGFAFALTGLVYYIIERDQANRWEQRVTD